MDPVKLGVIGCGVIAQQHLRAAKASPLIDVVAIADVREQVARDTAKTFGVPQVYTSADQLLDDPKIEAVVLALPTAPRTAMGLKAFARGKHLLTEKPVAMNSAEVRQLIAARGKLVGACCSSRMRSIESAAAPAKLIASGALGQLRVIHCRCIAPAGPPPKKDPPPWRLKKASNGGGILVNWGCYDLDYLLGLTGWSLKPRVVLAQVWTVPPQFESHIAPGSDAETHYIAYIRCDGGTVISIERSEYSPAADEHAWRIVGTRGSLRLQMTPTKGKKVYHDDSTTESGVTSKVIWEGDDDWQAMHAGPVQDFAAAIRENRPPRTGLEQALVLQQITDAIYASAQTGAAVTIQ